MRTVPSCVFALSLGLSHYAAAASASAAETASAAAETAAETATSLSPEQQAELRSMLLDLTSRSWMKPWGWRSLETLQNTFANKYPDIAVDWAYELSRIRSRDGETLVMCALKSDDQNLASDLVDAGATLDGLLGFIHAHHWPVSGQTGLSLGFDRALDFAYKMSRHDPELYAAYWSGSFDIEEDFPAVEYFHKIEKDPAAAKLLMDQMEQVQNWEDLEHMATGVKNAGGKNLFVAVLERKSLKLFRMIAKYSDPVAARGRLKTLLEELEADISSGSPLWGVMGLEDSCMNQGRISESLARRLSAIFSRR